MRFALRHYLLAQLAGRSADPPEKRRGDSIKRCRDRREKEISFRATQTTE